MTDLRDLLSPSTPSTVCMCCPSPRVTGLQVCQACWDARQPAVVDPVVDRVCGMLMERSRIGIAKYGTTLAENPTDLRGWLVHAMQESADQTLYLMRAIMELDKE